MSPRRLRHEFPDLAQHHYRANKLWSGTYLAGSLGGTSNSTTIRLKDTHGPSGPPTRAPTPVPKGGAPARIPVAGEQAPQSQTVEPADVACRWSVLVLPTMSTMLTKRRSVDFCRVAASLCRSYHVVGSHS